MGDKLTEAVALCRVSTSRQRTEGTSLEAQEKYIYDCAASLGAAITREPWSLDTSSKKGVNLARKDLHEIMAYCKAHKAVKFLILDEIDRFMRSVEEYYWWKVEFKKIGVRLAYAKMPEITFEDSPMVVFKEMVAIFQAEASNHERITKTRDKMQARVAAGYYPGCPRPGYKKGEISGLHIPTEPQWTQVRDTLKEIANGTYNIDQGLKRLHERGYKTRKRGKQIDMYRFKKMLLDPYYAGIIAMSNWPVSEHGLHQPMITVAEHEALVAIVEGKGKRFTMNKHNPLFPFSNSMECVACLVAGAKHPRLVGYLHNNGKVGNSRKTYLRYRCRGCKLNIRQDTLHAAFNEYPLRKLEEAITERFGVTLNASLSKIWRQAEGANISLIQGLENQLADLASKRDSLYMSLGTDSPEERENFTAALNLVKSKMTEVEGNLNRAKDREQDFLEFAAFALDVVNNWTRQWWELEHSDRQRCKQMLFPAGFALNQNKKVYTPEISIIYSGELTKTAPEEAEFTRMVTPAGFEPAIFWMRTKYPGPLDEGAICLLTG